MVSDRPSLRLGSPLTARLLACCAIGVSAGLSSCGGRATDGFEPEADGPGEPIPVEAPPLVRPVRETCEDNPLLAGCPYAGTSVSLPPPPPVEEPIPDEEPLYVAARNVLVDHCGVCHGSQLTEDQASAAINYIDDWNKLIQVGLVRACAPERSRIVQVMRTGEMPPPQSGWFPASDAEIELVVAAIERGCNDE